jgi:hypothetical protein
MYIYVMQAGSMFVLSTLLFAAQSLRYVKLSSVANIIKAAAKATTEAAVAEPMKKGARRVQPISFQSKAKIR